LRHAWGWRPGRDDPGRGIERRERRIKRHSVDILETRQSAKCLLSNHAKGFKMRGFVIAGILLCIIAFAMYAGFVPKSGILGTATHLPPDRPVPVAVPAPEDAPTSAAPAASAPEATPKSDEPAAKPSAENSPKPTPAANGVPEPAPAGPKHHAKPHAKAR
jgi:hypothetical protein